MKDPVYMRAGFIPVSRELLSDYAPVGRFIDEQLDRILRPWRYPDPNPMPHFLLFPRLALFVGGVRRVFGLIP